jgi:Cu+-exporting ATPase
MRLFERPEKKADIGISNYKTLTLKVSGMYCEECSRNIQKSLSKINGLRNLQPDFTNGEVRMEFDEGKVNLEKIRGAIRKAGFIARGQVEQNG